MPKPNPSRGAQWTSDLIVGRLGTCEPQIVRERVNWELVQGEILGVGRWHHEDDNHFCHE